VWEAKQNEWLPAVMGRLRSLASMIFFFVVDRNRIQILRFKHLTAV
jgi:hypothetical protein